MNIHEGESKSFRTGRLDRELQMVQLSATGYSFITILWVSLVSFSAITLFVASQRVFIVVSVYFVMDSVRKLWDTTSYYRTDSFWEKFWEQFAAWRRENCKIALNIIFWNLCIRLPLPHTWGQVGTQTWFILPISSSFKLGRNREHCTLQNNVTVNRDQSHI
jgi:hypothetical protein